MLTLERLAIRDFGPYLGRQEVSFSREDGVYIVYGPNGRGKTTLHNAFRYALYGVIMGRRRAENPRDVANTVAAKEAGYASFETTLDFQHQGRRYRLTRRYDEREHPQELMILEQDGVPLAQDDAAKALQIIAPLSVSQFFLFDGELLRQYQDLLEPDSEEGVALEASIERVLGVPIVGNAKADATYAWRSAEKQLSQQYAAHDETSRMGVALNEAQDVRARRQAAFDEVERNITDAKQRVSEIEAQLREQQKSERLLGNLDQLRRRLADLAGDEAEALAAIAAVSGDIWKAVLARSAGHRLSEVECDLASAEGDFSSAAAAVRDLDHLRRSPDCPVCHRDVAEGQRSDLIAGLEVLASPDHRVAVDNRVGQLRRQAKTLQPFAAQDGRIVVERDQRLRSVRLDRQQTAEDIQALEQQLAEVGEDELRALTGERDERQAQISRDKVRLESSAAELRDQDLEIEELKRKLRKQPVHLDHTIELKDQVAESLTALFGDAIDAYRTKLRLRVEQRASAIFRQLATEPDYRGLRITERYGLEIIDSEGDVVRRSAGYEHLVALSLIAALQDSAAVRGPVIMDYPFGRLDPENTGRVVAALPRMARQVVLLSFDGEFDRQVAVQALGGHLVAEYELERVSLKHTRINPRRTF
jgi:DNA sulfur modification protein DndD